MTPQQQVKFFAEGYINAFRILEGLLPVKQPGGAYIEDAFHYLEFSWHWEKEYF